MKERLYVYIYYIFTIGNEKQQIYDVLNSLNIMEDLALYNPVLCGTIPIRIDTPQSDFLDIVMEVYNFDVFEQEMRSLYGSYGGFNIKEKIKGTESIKVNFEFEGFEFELFAQPKPV